MFAKGDEAERNGKSQQLLLNQYIVFISFVPLLLLQHMACCPFYLSSCKNMNLRTLLSPWGNYFTAFNPSYTRNLSITKLWTAPALACPNWCGMFPDCTQLSCLTTFCKGSPPIRTGEGRNSGWRWSGTKLCAPILNKQLPTWVNIQLNRLITPSEGVSVSGYVLL